VPRSFTPLGTDGFGRSDTREALRQFFEIDAPNLVVATLSALAEDGTVDRSTVSDAIKRYELDPELADPRVR
jgi:pyruvate dehydrogenase E1 component